MLFTQHYDGCYDFIFYLKFSDEIFRTRTFKKKKKSEIFRPCVPWHILTIVEKELKEY